MDNKKEKRFIKSGEPWYPRYIDENTHVHVMQGNTKIGKSVYHFDTLPGHEPIRKKNGLVLTNVTGTCQGCDATCCNDCYVMNYIRFHHNSVVIPYADNTLLVKEDIERWEYEMRKFCETIWLGIFRHHVSGEWYSKEHLQRAIAIANDNPNIHFYGYTKRIGWINEHLDNVGDLPTNFVQNLSKFNDEIDNPNNLPEFIYDDGSDPEIAKLPHCRATDKNGRETGLTCEFCKLCMKGKRGQKIAVYAH